MVLEHQIETRLYERQALSGNVSNFSRTLPDPQSELARQQLKDPYVFDFITARQSHDEHDIEQQMVENVTKLLLELGTGFAFMGRQHHIVVGGEDFYIDLLFYNVKLHCYVVIELKNDKFRPEYTGKLSFYISAIDGELATDADNPTIGLLLSGRPVVRLSSTFVPPLTLERERREKERRHEAQSTVRRGIARHGPVDRPCRMWPDK